MEILMIVGGFACAAVVFVLVMFAVVAGLASIRERVAGVPACRAALDARAVDPRLRDVIVLELQQAANGTAPLFALIFLFFGMPTLLLGLSEVSQDRFLAAEDLAIYLTPGPAMIALAVLLLLRGRVSLERSETYVALFVRGPRAVELVPTTIHLWIVRANLVVNAVGMREKVLMPIPHVVIRYEDGTQHVMRALDDQDVRPTIAVLGALLPQCRVGTFVPSTPPALAQPA